MTMAFVFQFLSFFLLVGSTEAMYKRWLSDTNFENPANWNAKRAPCGNDVVIIPDDSPVVYMQINTSMKELTLPRNGEIILGQNVGIGFTDTASIDCDDFGSDLEFSAVHPVPWLDPVSWCSSDTERGGCGVNKTLLDVEQVPCAFDDVVFPRDHSYFVDFLDPVSQYSVKSFKVAGTSMTSSSLSTYLSSPEGQRIFRTQNVSTGGPLISVSRRSCGQPKGCACGNDRPDISSKICKYAEKRCKRPRCKATIQPVGSCCRLCGAVFNLTRGYGFVLDDFSRDLTTLLREAGSYNFVNTSLFVTSKDALQLSVFDVTGEKSASFARKVKQDFESDIATGGHKYRLDAVSLSLSMGPSTGSPSTSAHSASMSGGSVAGIVLGVIIALVIIIIVVVVFVFRRSGRPIPISIPKLPEVHMPSMPSLPSLPHLPRRTPRATARVPAQPQTSGHIDPGFTNPLYDTSPFHDGNEVMKEMELIATREEVQPTFDTVEGGINNPLYGTGAALFTDASQVGATSGVQDSESAATGESADVIVSSLPTVSTTASSAVLIEPLQDEKVDSTI